VRARSLAPRPSCDLGKAIIGRKAAEHSVTNRKSGLSTNVFGRKHWVLARFVSVRLLRIPKRVLRFYYATSKAKIGLR